MGKETEPKDLDSAKAAYEEQRPFIGNAVTDARIEIYEAAEFGISDEAEKPFGDFVKWINTRPHFICDWRSNRKTEQTLYQRFMTLSYGVRNGYAAVCYHLMRIKEIESSIDTILSKYDFSEDIKPNTTVALASILPLDFEYHAFVLAYRRCLDYLAWGFSAYFKQSQSSYNRFKKLLERAQPRSVAKALISVYDAYIEKFSFVVGTEKGKSLRDRIGHSEFTQAFAVNIRANEYKFIGGGEELKLSNPDDNRKFSEILEGKACDLHKCIAEFLRAFQDSVIAFEATHFKPKFKGPLTTQYPYYNVGNRNLYLKISTEWKIPYENKVYSKLVQNNL